MTAIISRISPIHSRKFRDDTNPPVNRRTIATTATMINRMFTATPFLFARSYFFDASGVTHSGVRGCTLRAKGARAAVMLRVCWPGGRRSAQFANKHSLAWRSGASFVRWYLVNDCAATATARQRRRCAQLLQFDIAQPNPGTKKPLISQGFLVGGTGIEPATSSVSGKRATAAPTARADIQFE